MTLKISRKSAVVTCLWVCVIFAFTLQPGEISGNLSDGLLGQILRIFCPQLMGSLSEAEFAVLHTVLRKCAHFTEFFILGILAFSALSANRMKLRFAVSAAFCALVASADETIQLFVPDRAGRILDVLLDCTGAVAGITAAYLAVCIIKSHRKKAEK